MKIINDEAVTEIIGTALLIAIAISVFSIYYLDVLSDPGPRPEAYLTIVGKLESGNVVFEHRRGEGININSRILLLLRLKTTLLLKPKK